MELYFFLGKNKTLIFTSAILNKKDQQQMTERIMANQHQRGCTIDGKALALHARGLGIDTPHPPNVKTIDIKWGK